MEDKKKLISVLKENNVNVSKKENICLDDVIENIICPKNSDNYKKKLVVDTVVTIHGKEYIYVQDCIDILKASKFKRCKEICTKIKFDNKDKSSIIDVENEIFQLDGQRFLTFFVFDENDKSNWQIWVKGKDIAKHLNYVNSNQAISDHVDAENKMYFKKLYKKFYTVKNRCSKKMHPLSVFINLSGIFNLIHHSKKEIAKKIKKWIDNEVILSLLKYGTYTMSPKHVELNYFHDNNTISQFNENKIKTLEKVDDSNNQSDRLMKLELQYKMSDNYKLKLETKKQILENKAELEKIRTNSLFELAKIKDRVETEKIRTNYLLELAKQKNCSSDILKENTVKKNKTKKHKTQNTKTINNYIFIILPMFL